MLAYFIKSQCDYRYNYYRPKAVTVQLLQEVCIILYMQHYIQLTFPIVYIYNSKVKNHTHN